MNWKKTMKSNSAIEKIHLNLSSSSICYYYFELLIYFSTAFDILLGNNFFIFGELQWV